MKPQRCNGVRAAAQQLRIIRSEMAAIRRLFPDLRDSVQPKEAGRYRRFTSRPHDPEQPSAHDAAFRLTPRRSVARAYGTAH